MIATATCLLTLLATAQQPMPPRVASEPLPFALVVGQHYQVMLPSQKLWPKDSSPVLVLKTYPNGWAEVKTEDNQTLTLNMTQVLWVYHIPDLKAWRKLAGR